MGATPSQPPHVMIVLQGHKGVGSLGSCRARYCTLPGPGEGPAKDRREKRVTVPSADAKLRRAVGMLRRLNGLQGRGKWNLLDATQGQEIPPRDAFEERLFSHAATSPLSAVGLHEKGEWVRCWSLPILCGRLIDTTSRCLYKNI